MSRADVLHEAVSELLQVTEQWRWEGALAQESEYLLQNIVVIRLMNLFFVNPAVSPECVAGFF